MIGEKKHIGNVSETALLKTLKIILHPLPKEQTKSLDAIGIDGRRRRISAGLSLFLYHKNQAFANLKT